MKFSWLSIPCAVGLAAAASGQTFSVSNNTAGPVPDCPLASPTWNVDPSLQAGGTWLPFTSTVVVPTPVTSITHVILSDINHSTMEQVHAYLTDPTGNNRYNFIVRPGWDFSTPGTGDLSGDYDIVESGGSTFPCCGTDAPEGTYDQYLFPPNGGWTSGTFVINNTPLNSISGPAGAWTLTIYDWAAGDPPLLASSISGWTLSGLTSTPGVVTICEPTRDGIIACPCGGATPPPGRGCNNSSNTGGATLTAAGVASVSSDTLVLTTTDEKPTALSIVLQGDEQLPMGAFFGDGVRCVGENLKRLYVKSAVAGSVTAPAGADPSITVRSAALGSLIVPGVERRYQVYYRDPAVFACPSPGGSRFNISVGLRIAWDI